MAFRNEKGVPFRRHLEVENGPFAGILLKDKVSNSSGDPSRVFETGSKTEENMTLKNIESKLDRCNHLMELLRTCLGVITLILQVVILLKLFDVI